MDGWMDGRSDVFSTYFFLTLRKERPQGRRTFEILRQKRTLFYALSQWMELQLSNTSKPTGNAMCDHSSIAHWSSVQLHNYLHMSVYLIYHQSIDLSYISIINLPISLPYLPSLNRPILSNINQSIYLSWHPSIYVIYYLSIIYLSIHSSTHLSYLLNIYYIYIYPSTIYLLSVSLSIHLPIYLIY
jgi:hypothetical protein